MVCSHLRATVLACGPQTPTWLPSSRNRTRPQHLYTRVSTEVLGLILKRWLSLIGFWDFLDGLLHDALSDALVSDSPDSFNDLLRDWRNEGINQHAAPLPCESDYVDGWLHVLSEAQILTQHECVGNGSRATMTERQQG